MIYFLTTTATKNQYAIKNSDAFMINKIIYKESIWSSQRKIHYILFSILLLYWSYINAGVFLGYPYDFFIIRRKDMFEKRESGLKHIYVIFKYFWSKYADLFLIKLMGKYINYFYDLLYLIMKKNPKTLNGQIFLKFWKFHWFLIFIFLL